MRRIAGWRSASPGTGMASRKPGSCSATSNTPPASTPTTRLVTPSALTKRSAATMIAPLRAAWATEGQAKRPSA